MKRSKLIGLITLTLFCLALFAGFAAAEDKLSVKGKISGYDLEAKTVTITADDGKTMTFSIESSKALEKLDDRLIKGDEVKIRYTEKGDRKIIKDGNDLRGTKPGC